ncbi:hypothetical protein AAW00_11715 [Aurantiacibacter luteus]|uniref:Uncharacterized protein n=1 Tax=Aurantiacibacter luteus TaxID=1581420 RepID=A0A0G9MWW2_9SPHN|nr:hypothetical protein AAW00_11715 [Aurantiacibacter luteus]
MTCGLGMGRNSRGVLAHRKITFSADDLVIGLLDAFLIIDIGASARGQQDGGTAGDLEGVTHCSLRQESCQSNRRL